MAHKVGIKTELMRIWRTWNPYCEGNMNFEQQANVTHLARRRKKASLGLKQKKIQYSPRQKGKSELAGSRSILKLKVSLEGVA